MGWGTRLQHAVAAASFVLAAVSGGALPWSAGLLGGRLRPLFGGPDTVLWWHSLLGTAAAVSLGAHLAYLMVRAYVESLSWSAFPYRLSAGDLGDLPRQLGGLLLGRGHRGRRNSPVRKLFYWSFLLGGTLLVGSGLLVRHWARLDSAWVTAHLDLLAGLHGGLGFALAALLLLHAHASVDGGRQPGMVLAALTGRVPAAVLAGLYPEDLPTEAEGARVALPAELDQELRREAVLDRERESIQQVLEEGNDLARQGRLAEAADRFRWALELYPGYSQAQYNLGLVLEREGRDGEALEAYRRFMEIDPFHPLSDRVREAIARLEGKTRG
jgi:tetratricopeptide (TPR) repeat protein